MASQEERLLRAAFLLGAITDALALIPMLFPTMTRLLWGTGRGSQVGPQLIAKLPDRRAGRPRR